MLSIRKIQVAPSLRCWSYHTTTFPLPAGMPDRAEGIVLTRTGNLVTVEVQGIIWELHWWQVDCGHEYQIASGEWIREPDPRVRQYVESMLEDTHGTRAGAGPMRDYWIDQCTWVLERNGW